MEWQVYCFSSSHYSWKDHRFYNLTGESTSGEKSEIYKEWTSRRSWKERKQATKVRENSSKLLSVVQEPELIYYGRNSGVVGFSKKEVYKNVSSSEVSHYGYDKVHYIVLSFCFSICESLHISCLNKVCSTTLLVSSESDWLHWDFKSGTCGCRMHTWWVS